jgi:hypothetical protein
MALPCPAGRSVPGRRGPERRRRPRPDGTEPAGSRSWATLGPQVTGEQRTTTVSHGSSSCRMRWLWRQSPKPGRSPIRFPTAEPQVRNLSRLLSFPQVRRLSWPLVAAWGWTRRLARHSFSGTRRPRGGFPCSALSGCTGSTRRVSMPGAGACRRPSADLPCLPKTSSLAESRAPEHGTPNSCRVGL